jgi:broad specificity phosphatase PhoE
MVARYAQQPRQSQQPRRAGEGALVLIVVRHGRTAVNAEGRLLGRADPPLDDTGAAQALALAAFVGDRDAVRAVSSPLLRARQTAEAFGLPVTIDDRWIELDYGQLDGQPVADVDPEVWRQWRADPSFAPIGGESLTALGARVADACRDLADEAATADVVVVSHVSPIKAAVAWALGVGDEISFRLYVSAGSVTRIRIGDHGPVVVSFNETAHLAG